MQTVTQLEKKWANNVLLLSSVVAILICTLFPYDFFFVETIRKLDYQNIHALLVQAFDFCDLSDLLNNWLLFLPLGFGLTWFMQGRKLGQKAVLVKVLIISASLSFTVEFFQTFLPWRDPSFFDVFNNTLGSFWGFLCFRLWSVKIFTFIGAFVEKGRKDLSLQSLTIAFLGYLLLTSLILLPFHNDSILNWDKNFPLLVGNEATGNRPWSGTVSEFSIADKALSPKEVAEAFKEKETFKSFMKDALVASYNLSGKGNYADSAGLLPELSWKGKSREIQDEGDAFLSPSHWLEASPTDAMTSKILQTSQFTINAHLATAAIPQKGPARIISLSENPYTRNFTLGQEGTSLSLRLRTFLTGNNGADPELLLTDFFTNTNPHHLILTYDKSVLRLYVDGKQLSSLELSPIFSLFWRFLPVSHVHRILHFNAITPKICHLIYYAVVFIPLGAILAIITTILRGQFIFYLLLILGGIVLPTFILEVILESGRTINLENLLLSIAIASCSMLVVKNMTTS